MTFAWTLYARDAAGDRQAQLDDFSSCELVPRFNDVGSWMIDAPASSPAAVALTTPGWGVEIVRDGVVVLSGPTTHQERTRDGASDMLHLAGVDDNVWLRRRLGVPQPATPAPPYNLQTHDVRTGVASTVLRQYVDVNAGPSALSPRRVPGLTIGTDPVVGASMAMRARYHPLLEIAQFMGTFAGLGFRIRDLTFEVYTPVDHSGDVVFSIELGDLASHTYSVDAPETDYAYVLGGGAGTARTIVEKQDSEAIANWGRMESSVDRRDTTDATELSNAGQEELTNRSQRSGVAITPVDMPGRAFLVDYELGDMVTVVIDDVAIVDVVREVHIALDADGEAITPNIGAEGLAPRWALRLFRQLRQINERVGRIEVAQ